MFAKEVLALTLVGAFGLQTKLLPHQDQHILTRSGTPEHYLQLLWRD